MEHLQQLELKCPFCGETQPREFAQWDEQEIGYLTVCQTCGKQFSGLTLVSAYISWSEPKNTQKATEGC